MNFRRWITALAVLALFVGLAGAQVQGPGTTGPLTCTATVAVPPALRAEGITDLIGDIVITCTGGVAVTVGQPIPTANFTVSLPTTVTSRIIGSSGLSEALLMIDEPGSSLTPVVPSFGPGALQKDCGSNLGAGPGGPCVEFAQQGQVVAGGVPTGLFVPVASSSASTPVPTFNVFYGTVVANQVTFNGIPILPPVTTGSVRVFRITNIRANISGAPFSGLAGTSALGASITISGNTSVPVNQSLLTVGYIQFGLSTAVRNANNTGGAGGSGTTFNQCNSSTNTTNPSSVATLQFTENFGTAFKTRVAPYFNPATGAYQYGGQAGAGLVQNVPGQIYNSESGFVLNNPTAVSVGGIQTGTILPGLADYGTRLKAVFKNLPAGVHLYVSVTNLANNTSSSTTPAPAMGATSSFAQLVAGDTIPDGNGQVPALSPTTTANSAATALFEVTPASGGAVAGAVYTAVWEVINTNPAALETFNFGVWLNYSSSVAAPSAATVNLSYAPTYDPTVTSQAGAFQASNAYTIPRFVDNSGAGNGLLNFVICQTLLLFPYVTNESGLETGMAISNTSKDPLGTSTQTGTCTLSFYNGTTIPDKTVPDTGTIAAGTTYANILSSFVNGAFTGYVFARCNFQFAHGLAFISDAKLANFAMGYLALVINNNSNLAGRRTTITAENQGQ